jgi:hypothetical protein
MEGRGWEGFPRRAYGRLDRTEPLDPTEAQEAVFAFDSVDANWPGFSPGGKFDLTQERPSLAEFWYKRFEDGRLSGSIFDDVPIFWIEITARPQDRVWGTLQAFWAKPEKHDWVELTLDRIGSYPVDVYGGLFAAAAEAHLVALRDVEWQTQTALSATFDVGTWPDAKQNDMEAIFSQLRTLDILVAYDVGQGNAVGLLDAGENVRLFFDLGGGVYANKMTRPNPLRFCWRKGAPIVLSHWDTDHWSGEASDPGAAGRTWVAPRQTNLGPTHHAFAARILGGGGRLLIWGGPPGGSFHVTTPVGQKLTFCRGTGHSRNGSGIVCFVENGSGCSWLLPGDAGYDEIPLAFPPSIEAIVVPHHGADMGSRSASCLPKRPSGYGKLLYSFGPGNKHGRSRISHPTAAAVAAHTNGNWQHGNWPAATPGRTRAQADVLATANNPDPTATPPLPGGHLGGESAGWSGPPTTPFTTVPCWPQGLLGGCTTAVDQS